MKTCAQLYVRKGLENYRLVGYSNSDMAAEVDDGKSTTGTIFFLVGNLGISEAKDDSITII